MLVRVSTWAVYSMSVPSFLYALLVCATSLEHITLVKPVLEQLTPSSSLLGLREGRAYVCLATPESNNVEAQIRRVRHVTRREVNRY